MQCKIDNGSLQLDVLKITYYLEKISSQRVAKRVFLFFKRISLEKDYRVTCVKRVQLLEDNTLKTQTLHEIEINTLTYSATKSRGSDGSRSSSDGVLYQGKNTCCRRLRIWGYFEKGF